MLRLEEKLRGQFSPEVFPRGISAQKVVRLLWQQTTAPHSRGILLLTMDVARRAWSGSERAKAFYEEQQRLWVKLLLQFLPDEAVVEELLRLFQGCVLAFLITGDREAGERALMQMLSNSVKTRKRARRTSSHAILDQQK